MRPQEWKRVNATLAMHTQDVCFGEEQNRSQLKDVMRFLLQQVNVGKVRNEMATLLLVRNRRKGRQNMRHQLRSQCFLNT